MARTRARLVQAAGLLLALVIQAGATDARAGGADPPPGTTWRYRDAQGRLHFTDNPESIPAQRRSGATTIAPLTDEEQRARQVPSKVNGREGELGGLLDTASGSTAPRRRGLPVTAVAVYAAESVLLWGAARSIGLLIEWPAVALVCALSAALRWLDVRLVSSLGAFIVLVLLVWRLGRAESMEVGLLFVAVAALIHLLTLWALLRLPAVTVG